MQTYIVFILYIFYEICFIHCFSMDQESAINKRLFQAKSPYFIQGIILHITLHSYCRTELNSIIKYKILYFSINLQVVRMHLHQVYIGEYQNASNCTIFKVSRRSMSTNPPSKTHGSKNCTSEK